MKTILLVLILITSCTHMNEIQKQRSEWIGRNIEEVAKHPVFSHFKVKERPGKDGDKIFTYIDGPSVLSDARCQGLGGCMGVDNYWCEHNFTTKNNKVLKYEQYGPCPYNPKLAPTEAANK